ncbi:ExbD/TolR family protein [Chitinophaga qingshengii]|uniref:Biopolymer transporter ExbD n=1 Tax=Chitinophaga qingshengii TaxID=1569794 RepID=A0ABR7TWU4_9BACT|nr:biopolymer transporter ExbD [Chitinophaga qingshengii]MBC9934951.1 biopolymer transporter ExbD [Chitinophaga qingshengii]
MPRSKVTRKSTLVDMTAMTDMVFLLLTFFMLATRFKPAEPVAVVTPSSINTQLLPDSDVILFTMDKKGRVFFDMDGQPKRQQLIDALDKQFKLGLTAGEKYNFVIGTSIGTELKHLKNYLAMSAGQRKGHAIETGIPTDSTANEVAVWLEYATSAQHEQLRSLKYCVKADNEAPYQHVKKLLATFRDQHIQHVNLVTNLKANPMAD